MPAAAPKKDFMHASPVLEEVLSLMQRHGCDVERDVLSIGLACRPYDFSEYCYVKPAQRFEDYAIARYYEVGVGGYNKFEVFSCGSEDACLALLCAMMLNRMRQLRMITAGEEDDQQIVRLLMDCKGMVLESIPEEKQSDEFVTLYLRIIGS